MLRRLPRDHLASGGGTIPRSITIRAARKSDREWCARLMAGNEPWRTLRRGVRDIRKVLRRPGMELFIASEGKRRLGFVLLHPYGLAGSPYINSIAVEEGRRGRGIGSLLLYFAEKHFAGRQHLFLCVSSFNLRAQKLYRKLDYRRVAVLKDYVVANHAEILMHKRLP